MTTEIEYDEATDVPTDEGTDDLEFDGADGAVATVVTTGDPFRSWLDGIGTAIGLHEVRFRFEPDGIRISAVDVANVAFIDTKAPASAFTGYDVRPESGDAVVVGMPLDMESGGDLPTALGYARKRPGNGDPVRIDVIRDGDATRIRVEVIRPDQQTKRTTEFFGIDPASIRQEPDIPDLNAVDRATPDVDAFVEAIDAIKGSHDHAWLSRDGKTLTVGSQPGRNPTLDADDAVVDVITFPNTAWSIEGDDAEAGDGSCFSMDYLMDFAKSLKRLKADRITVSYDDTFPAIIDWDTTDWGISGTLMVAPRVPADDGDGDA